MVARRSFGSIFRRKRRLRSQSTERKDDYYPGWYVRYRRGGREVTRYAGPDHIDAEVFLKRVEARIQRGDPTREAALPEIRFEAYAKEYLAFSRRDHSASTASSRKSLVERRLIPFFRGMPMIDIGPRDVERLLSKMADTSPATRNRLLSALSTMFKRAMELGYARTNPASACRRAREHVTPLPLVSIEDQVKLIAALPAERRTLFLTALDTGARLGELLRLRWHDVEYETGSLLLRQTKNRHPRVVRMSRRVVSAIQQSQPRTWAGSDVVFASAVGGGGTLRSSWRRSFKLAAASIGQPSLRIHDLRHLAAINLVRAGIDLPTIQAHLGHKHLISTLRYAAYADRTASARAAEALDQRFAGLDEASPDPDSSGGGG